jgi:hypothetical protein
MAMHPIPPAFALVLLPLALLGCAAAKPDSLVSAAMQQDCSVLNLDRGLPYCRPLPAAPEPPPFCTRSRGSVDCWRQPPAASPPYRGLADTPAMPPAEHQPRPWPRFSEEPAPVRAAEPGRMAPLVEPMPVTPAADPVRAAPAEAPARLAPAADPGRPAPVEAPLRLAPAGADRPT